MTHHLSLNWRKGFTLIELIIVILLISLMAFMTFSTLVKHQKRVEKLTPLTLPQSLKKLFIDTHEDVELFCIRKSTLCYMARGSEILPFEGLIALGKDLEVYKVDRDNQLVKMDELGEVKDEKITFRYTLYANGTTSQLILTNSEGIYYLPSYFEKPQQVESLDEALNLWVKPQYDLGDSGSYY